VLIKMFQWLEKNRWIAIILTIIITIEIFYFSSLPGNISTGSLSFLTIIYHFIVFFLFSFFLFIAIKGNQKLKAWHILAVIGIAIIHAFLDEFHQSFTPLRDPSFRDIIINAFGIFSATILYLYSSKNKTKKQKR